MLISSYYCFFGNLLLTFLFHLQAQQLNKEIFETIYYHALKASSEIAAREGPYETYEGSPVSKVCISDFLHNCFS